MSRASRELARAPVSPCPHCGRETKTVRGVCAECWRAKEPGAQEVFRSGPRTWRLFHWDWDVDDVVPWLVVLGGIALVVAFLRVVLA